MLYLITNVELATDSLTSKITGSCPLEIALFLEIRLLILPPELTLAAGDSYDIEFLNILFVGFYNYNGDY